MFQGFFKSLRNKCLLGLSLLGLSTSVFATSGQVLQSSDFVGITFWLISMALVASTAFFFLERDRVAGKWKTSLTVSGLVTLVAAVHYFYMRDVWVATGSTPTVYRYIDWLITVPLLMIEFYLILSAITKVSTGVFWRLVIGTLVMLVGGYVGEAGYADVMTSFTIYPLGYYFGYLTGADPASSMASLNIIYNLADVLNKIAFGVIIWSVAVSESK